MKWHFNILTALVLALALLAWFTPSNDCGDDDGRETPRVSLHN